LDYTTISFICMTVIKNIFGDGRTPVGWQDSERSWTMPGHDRPLHSTFVRPSRSSLHLVQGAHEKTVGCQRAIYPLHVSQMHLPAHDSARARTAHL